jgi:hypothetical protein
MKSAADSFGRAKACLLSIAPLDSAGRARAMVGEASGAAPIASWASMSGYMVGRLEHCRMALRVASRNGRLAENVRHNVPDWEDRG